MTSPSLSAITPAIRVTINVNVDSKALILIVALVARLHSLF
jgi:hypothetical protein